MDDSMNRFRDGKNITNWECGYCQGATEQLKHDLTMMMYVLCKLDCDEQTKEMAYSLFIEEQIDENIFK